MLSLEGGCWVPCSTVWNREDRGKPLAVPALTRTATEPALTARLSTRAARVSLWDSFATLTQTGEGDSAFGLEQASRLPSSPFGLRRTRRLRVSPSARSGKGNSLRSYRRSPTPSPASPTQATPAKLSCPVLNPRRSRAFNAAPAPRQRLAQAGCRGSPMQDRGSKVWP